MIPSHPVAAPKGYNPRRDHGNPLHWARSMESMRYYGATFRSLFGDVPVRVQRLLVCPCRGAEGAKSLAVLDLGGDALAPELAYVTARHAALAPFGKVAALLS